MNFARNCFLGMISNINWYRVCIGNITSTSDLGMCCALHIYTTRYVHVDVYWESFGVDKVAEVQLFDKMIR